MRKMQKDSIVEIVNLLKKAQEHVKNLLLQQEYASVLDLLQQCQQGAIQIGTTIEEAEGEGFPTVKKLEEYCELIFQVFEMVQGCMEQTESGDGVCKPDADVIFGALDRLLCEIEESIQKDIMVRKEVVFLPYKASMWDSLESVWMAADADPECDAYVVPIPYFDKNPDGTAKEMHYEGDLYPDYVPITHYDDYNIEQRHPDMIYIHNPYDEANFVTNVHPMFYAKRLKELTECLVYIPYFVLSEINPKDKAAVKGMEHFVMLPGVIHAHKVVVQSEAMRQIYIDVMTEAVGEETRHYWEEKILGTGSPKFDKIHNTTKENVKVPNEWLEIIEKPDGQWKKIIFYNTSVTALLENDEKMLDKMRDVFETFKENKEEVALLWRPHPLIKATIESMRPRLWEQYRKLVEEYKAEGWGIYDDTPDMDRAVALCDGYYGDPSSVVQLCREAGKPVMLQDVDCMNNQSTEARIIAENCIMVNDKLIFVARDMNLVCSVNLETKETEVIGSIPQENMFGYRLGAKIILWKQKLIFVPLSADKIWIYCLETKSWNGMRIRKRSEDEMSCKAFQATLYKDFLFMFAYSYPSIIKIDLEERKVTYFDNIFSDIKKEYGTTGICYFHCDYAQKNSDIYLASCHGNFVLKFDVATDNYEWMEVGSKGNKYSGIAWDGEYFWLAPRQSTAIVRWDGKDGVKEYELPKEIKEMQGLFLGGVAVNNQIVFPGNKNKKTLIFSEEGKVNMKIVDKQYIFYKRINDDCIVRQMVNGEMVKQGILGEVTTYIPKIEHGRISKFIKRSKEDINYFLIKPIKENNLLNLKQLCEVLIQLYEKQQVVMAESLGKVIWNNFKK